MNHLIPCELSEKERLILEDLIAEIDVAEFENYLEKAQAHLREGQEAALLSPSRVCLKVLEEIWDTILLIERDWGHFDPTEQKLLCAMVRYFSRSYDEIADFESEIGLDDDVEVLNACMRKVGRPDLCIKERESSGS